METSRIRELEARRLPLSGCTQRITSGIVRRSAFLQGVRLASGPWILHTWSGSFELRLGAGLAGANAFREPFTIASSLEELLQTPQSERTLCAIDSALGGTRPFGGTPSDLAQYHAALKRRISHALEVGRLQVTERAPLNFGGLHLAVPPAEAAPAEEPAEQSDEVSLEVKTLSGDAVEDDAGFTLTLPDGTTEDAKLSGGTFRKPSVPPGSYRVKFKLLKNARWMSPGIRCGEEAQLWVEARGFDAGTQVTFKVYEESHPPDAEPLAELKAKVADGSASAMWRHEQKPGASPGGGYLFEAEVSGKWASSAVLRVEPHPLSDLLGVKERLMQLRYDPGELNADATPALEDALKQFQTSYGFPKATGRADADTLEALENVT